jgi:hypothetical protein
VRVAEPEIIGVFFKGCTAQEAHEELKYESQNESTGSSVNCNAPSSKRVGLSRAQHLFDSKGIRTASTDQAFQKVSVSIFDVNRPSINRMTALLWDN